jgi:hypothetical protein
VDFVKRFIYPYDFPHILLWLLLDKESVDEKLKTLCKKWLCDIFSGESFYKRNKDYFTKSEAHFFLVSDIPYKNSDSLIEQYFYSKCLARKMGVKLSRKISRIFTLKFVEYWDNNIVTGFLDLIARSENNDIELDDICDFVIAIIKGRKNFSFSGRTMISVIALANEWHAEIAEQRTETSATKKSEALPTKWKGISINISNFEDDDFAWQFAQLHTVRDLLNEGRLMKNCVSSYSPKCAVGDSAIFHLSRIAKDTQNTKEIATLEVSKNRTLIQAKEKCNAKVSQLNMKAIRKWTKANNIKAD